MGRLHGAFVTTTCFRGLALAGVVAAAAMTPPGAQASTGTTCRALGGGSPEVMPVSAESALRRVTLARGDALLIGFSAHPGALGFVTLLTAPGLKAGQLLLGGGDGTSVVHIAGRSGTYELLFAVEGTEAANFQLLCAPAGTPLPPAMEAAREARGDDSGGLLHLEPPKAAGTPARGAAAAPGPSHTQSRLQWIGAPPAAGTAAEAPASNLGVRMKLEQAVTFGMLVQFDEPAETRLGAAALSERNWLAGPTTTLQLAPNLSLDARAAWGAFAGLGSHGAERRLLDARLTNAQAMGGWRLSPSVGFNYLAEKYSPETATAAAGRVDIRPEVAYRFDMDNAMFIQPRAALGAIWDFGSGAAVPGVAALPHQDMRLKAETGIVIGNSLGTRLQIGGSVEEGATGAEKVWGGRLQLDVPLK